VFRLSATDLDRALVAPPSELAETSWMERDSGGSSEALIRHGTELMEIGSFVEAEETLEQARRLDPYNGKAWAQLGLVYMARARYEQAIAAYQKAARLAPGDAEPLLNLGMLLADLGRDDEAIAAYDECLNRDGKLAKAYFHRGSVRLRRGAASQARDDFNRFVELGGEIPLPLRPLIEAQPAGAPP
jgi:tetratricopeptide (TPR) repeat protein